MEGINAATEKSAVDELGLERAVDSRRRRGAPAAEDEGGAAGAASGSRRSAARGSSAADCARLGHFEVELKEGDWL